MPFWWARRRKPWYSSRWKRRRPRIYKRRKRRFRVRRRRPYGRRRRRRRRTKVRRKKQKIPIQQWQPDSIVKCKIKGVGCLVAGAEGRQFYCYTNEVGEYIHPKAPGGGGFGAELYTLSYLYKQWLARRCIWTKSNDYKDLVRYTGTTIRIFRHPTTDFIVSYNRQPPFLLEKDYYNDIHPFQMLLQRHRKIIPSLKRKPHGKLYTKIKIKPPKQMITKWFFQKDFADHGLFIIQAAAANLGWAFYGPNTQSRLVTFYALNNKFYTTTDWGKASTTPWYPHPHYPTSTPYTFHYPQRGGTEGTYTPNPRSYAESVSYDQGFFCIKVLQATKITEGGSAIHNIPITTCRYNPELDTGQGNAVWLTTIASNNNWEKPHDSDLIIVGKPIWLAFYGFYNYILKVKKDKGWLLSSMFVVQSPAIKRLTPHDQTVFPIIDLDFIKGQLPYSETISATRKQFWYPQVENQLITINSFVESGPLIPKYSYMKESTWELMYDYCCYFKWGGPYMSDQPVQDPENQGKYDVPDTVTQTIQIADPKQTHYKQLLRAWDYRRGIITTRALKRMSEYLKTDSSISSDDSETPQKKKKFAAEIPHHTEKTEKIQKCLLSLCEEPTLQETENLQLLIQQQQQQQQKLKHNIIKLLIDLKSHQRALQLQTGLD